MRCIKRVLCSSDICILFMNEEFFTFIVYFRTVRNEERVPRYVLNVNFCIQLQTKGLKYISFVVQYAPSIMAQE